MPLLTAVGRRTRAGASGGSAPAGTGTTINALVGTFNTTGTGTVSWGFSLKQGQLTDTQCTAKKVVVKVGGTEQACYVEALRGRYPDGTIRSVLIQFSYNTSTTPADATVEVGGSIRSTTDISKDPITSTILEAGRYIIPKDVSHTKDCWATFMPILAASSETATHTGHLVNQLENRYTAGETGGLTSGTYQSTYDVAIPLIARWQANGSTSATYRGMLWNGLQRAYYMMTNAFLPASGTTLWSPNPNPNSLTRTGNGALPAEWHSQQQQSWAAAYLLTGCIEYWNCVCIRASWKTWRNSSANLTDDLHDDAMIGPAGLPRFNLRGFWSLMLSVVIDANKGFSGVSQGWTGRSLGGTNAATELPWYMDAINVNRYAKGDYRDNFRGCDDGCTDASSNAGYTGPGDFPNFQGALFTRALLFWYFNVQATATVAGYIKTNVDFFIDNNLVAITGNPPSGPNETNYNAGARWGCSYLATGTAGSAGTGNSPWTLPMWADVIAFCKAYYGDAKYGTALGRVLAEANVEGDNSGGSLGGIGNLTWGNLSSNWSEFWKLFGESFAYACAAPYLDVTGLPSGLPSSIATTTQY